MNFQYEGFELMFRPETSAIQDVSEHEWVEPLVRYNCLCVYAQVPILFPVKTLGIVDLPHHLG